MLFLHCICNVLILNEKHLSCAVCIRGGISWFGFWVVKGSVKRKEDKEECNVIQEVLTALLSVYSMEISRQSIIIKAYGPIFVPAPRFPHASSGGIKKR